MIKAKDNPFSSDRILRVRYRPLQGSFADIAERLTALSYRAAIVGPPGAGKTTLLEDLAASLKQQGFSAYCFKLEQDRGSSFRLLWQLFSRHWLASDICFIDSADLMPQLNWQLVLFALRRAGGIVITAHRTGRLPTLLECRTKPELLTTIVCELAGEAAAASAQEYYFRHQGDLRAALREMYDRSARAT